MTAPFRTIVNLMDSADLLDRYPEWGKPEFASALPRFSSSFLRELDPAAAAAADDVFLRWREIANALRESVHRHSGVEAWHDLSHWILGGIVLQGSISHVLARGAAFEVEEAADAPFFRHFTLLGGHGNAWTVAVGSAYPWGWEALRILERDDARFIVGSADSTGRILLQGNAIANLQRFRLIHISRDWNRLDSRLRAPVVDREQFSSLLPDVSASIREFCRTVAPAVCERAEDVSARLGAGAAIRAAFLQVWADHLIVRAIDDGLMPDPRGFQPGAESGEPTFGGLSWN